MTVTRALKWGIGQNSLSRFSDLEGLIRSEIGQNVTASEGALATTRMG
jgi:hypothetical protein